MAVAVPDVRDARYWEQVARIGATTRDALLSVDRREQLGKQDFDEGIRRLMEDRGKAIGQTRKTSNKEGLFYSGQLGKREGEVRTDYGRQETDARGQLARQLAGFEEERTQARQGEQEQSASALYEAQERQYERDLANPPTPAAPAAPGVPAVGRPGAKPKPAAGKKPVSPWIRKTPPKPRGRR